jgi:PhzF family phenazine biosynthesis protein
METTKNINKKENLTEEEAISIGKYDPLWIINAFSRSFYEGNPAAIVALSDFPSDKKMQKLAKEFNLSETAFFCLRSPDLAQIRWFSPTQEISLCGHATLATASVIFSHLYPEKDKFSFISSNGMIETEKYNHLIQLTLPLEEVIPFITEEKVLKALGKTKPAESYLAPESHNLILIYDNVKKIKSLNPDFLTLLSFKDLPFTGIAVSALDENGYVCRYFAPWEGINEDPVTGSAQTYLAPFWSKRLNKKLLAVRQISSRGGSMEVKVLSSSLLVRGATYTCFYGNFNSGWRE